MARYERCEVLSNRTQNLKNGAGKKACDERGMFGYVVMVRMDGTYLNIHQRMPRVQVGSSVLGTIWTEMNFDLHSRHSKKKNE